MAWDAKAIVVNDRKFKGRGNRASGASFDAAPNIDHSQPFVKQDLSEWLQWLRTEIGFDGWRYAHLCLLCNSSMLCIIACKRARLVMKCVVLPAHTVQRVLTAGIAYISCSQPGLTDYAQAAVKTLRWTGADSCLAMQV